MASYLIQNGSLKVNGEKTVMTVTFEATDGRSVTQYYEVDSTNPAEVEKVLAAAALSFEGMATSAADVPNIQTGTAVTVEPEVTPES